jgi:hypothetical protein
MLAPMMRYACRTLVLDGAAFDLGLGAGAPHAGSDLDRVPFRFTASLHRSGRAR